MQKNNLADFVKIWDKDKVALIDADNKVCLGISRKMAEHMDELAVQEMLYPIWREQVALQKKN